MTSYGSTEYRYSRDLHLAEIARLDAVGMGMRAVVVQLQAKFHVTEATALEVYREFQRRHDSAENSRAIIRFAIGGGAIVLIVSTPWTLPPLELPARVDVLFLWLLVAVAAVSLWFGIRVKKRMTTGERNTLWGIGQVALVLVTLFSVGVLSVVQFKSLPANENPPEFSDITLTQFPNEVFSATTTGVSGSISNSATHWKAVNFKITHVLPGNEPGETVVRARPLPNYEVKPGETKNYSFTVFPIRAGEVEVVAIEWDWQEN